MSYINELKTEAKLINFTGNMETVLTGDPSRFNIDPVRATAYATTRSNFMNAYETYHTDATHSTPYRVKKDDMKGHLFNSTRDLCEQFLADKSLDNTTLALVGLRRRQTSGTPAPTPNAAPLVIGRVDSATSIALSFRDEADRDRRAKPAGVRQVAVATFIGDAPPASIDLWGQPMLLGRTNHRMEFPNRPDITVWVTAWWVNSRNISGPASRPQSFRIAGLGSVVPASGQQPSLRIAA